MMYQIAGEECQAIVDELFKTTELLVMLRCTEDLQQRKCRPPVRSLIKLARRVLSSAFQSDLDAPWRHLLGNLLLMIADADSATGHRLLVKLTTDQYEAAIQADALEFMAFEKRQFDCDLILQHLIMDQPECKILSALYALEFHSFAKTDKARTETYVVPFLQHQSPMVRSYAISVIAWNAEYAPVIAEALQDPDESVRAQARRSLDMIANLWDLSD